MRHRSRHLEEVSEETGPQGGMFRSLQRYPNYRLLLAGQMATSAAQWMEQVARGWLIYDLTGSAWLLGLVQATRAAPLLVLGIFGGVAADRWNRKGQLIVAQMANMVLNLILAGLILSGRLETWHIFVTALLAGSVMAFQQPARQSLIPDVVDRKDLMNAIALNSGVLNLNRTLGPAAAGWLIGWMGVGGAYLVQAGFFLFASVWTIQLHVINDARERRTAQPQESLWRGFAEIVHQFGYFCKNDTTFSSERVGSGPNAGSIPSSYIS